MAKRSVFEEVSAPPPSPGAAPAGPAERVPWRRGIAAWLWLLAGLVAVMVLVGGATRLTDSGLSITEWAPVMGALPPLGAQDWQAAFAAYQTTTEFQEQNRLMTLAEFKVIYWWEWGHRQLGRVIGVVWLVGFAIFLAARRIPVGWTGRLILPAALGAVQAGIGWWMVASGLVGRLDVAPYRLAVHLGLAFAIFGLLVWYALRVRLDPVETLKARRLRPDGLGRWSIALIVLVFAQILSGGLVAGLDAGQGHIDWPLMEGAFFPATALDLTPVWLNLFENPALAQFVHRMLAYLIVALGAAFVWRTGRAGLDRVRGWGRIAGLAVLAQAVLGVVTLMNAAPLPLALAHQGLGVLLFFVLIRARFEIAYPRAQRLRSGV